MKYFTKEWYELMQRLDYCLCMRPIADGEYTDADIKRLYDKKLKAEIARDRRDYNDPPTFIDFDIDDMDIDDFTFFDPQTGKLEKAASKAEITERIEAEKAAAWAEFNSRPPFDPAETVENFERMYEGGLKHGLSHYPEWAQKLLDPRLVALSYLPRTVYDRLKAESRRNKKEFERIERTARKALEKESARIPERILDIFSGFHDARIMRLDKLGDDIAMLVALDCACFEGETPYVRVLFKNAEIVESDGLPFNDGDSLRMPTDEGYDICLTYLYDEFYAVDGGIEAHFLLSFDDLKYFTVRCADIVCEKNLEFKAE